MNLRARSGSTGFNVDPSSFNVLSKTMLRRLYLALARMQQIGNEDLLKMLEVPGYKEISERRNREMAMAAAAKQGQKGRR